jgi:hypothetical protein
LYTGGVTVAAGHAGGNFGGVVIAGRLSGPAQFRVLPLVGKAPRAVTAYKGFKGGVTVAVGDLGGDGPVEIITGRAKGNVHTVKVYTVGQRFEAFSFAGLEPIYTGGMRVGAVDRDGDGKAEILVGAGPSAAGPRVKVFDGLLQAQIDAFFAFAQSYPFGVFVG